MNDEGLILDENNNVYDLNSFGINEEYYRSEVEGLKL